MANRSKQYEPIAKFVGFPFFKTPQDLLAKLDHDKSRMVSSNLLRSYAAYDFFVTADNLCDWWWQCSQKPETLKDFRQNHPLRRVVAQIANSAKHFRSDNPNHQSVSELYRDCYAEDYFAEDYTIEHPTAVLDKDAASAIGAPETMTLQDLAELVYSHWKDLIAGSDTAN